MVKRKGIKKPAKKKAAKASKPAKKKASKPKPKATRAAEPAPEATASSSHQLHEELMGDGQFLQITVDLEALTVTLSGTVPDEELGRFATWDALCSGYPALWRAIVERFDASPVGGDDNEDDDGEPIPMDLRAERARLERRAAVRPTAADDAWEAKLDRARELLSRFDGQAAAMRAVQPRLRGDVDLSAKALAESLTYVIEIDREAGEVPLGGSKYGGRPHLPDELAWPTRDGEPMYLLVQLDLAELAAADVSGLVPARGTLYAFITETGRGQVLYTPSRALSIREPSFTPPDHMRELLDDEERLTFAPAFYFDQATGDTGGPGAIAAALPATLRDQIASILGCSAGPSNAFGGDRIFGGDPVDWQAMGQSYLRNPLFAQICHGDGHQSIGVDPDDLRVANFADADCRYCGT